MSAPSNSTWLLMTGIAGLTAIAIALILTGQPDTAMNLLLAIGVAGGLIWVWSD